MNQTCVRVCMLYVCRVPHRGLWVSLEDKNRKNEGSFLCPCSASLLYCLSYLAISLHIFEIVGLLCTAVTILTPPFVPSCSKDLVSLNICRFGS